MHSKHPNVRADAHKMAVLSVVWGVVAGVAYLGLVKRGVNLIEATTGWAGPSTSFDSGLTTIDPVQAGHAHTAVYTVAIAALPIAIVVILVLGIFARVRPSAAVLSGLLIPAALLGLVGVILLFLDVVVTVKNRNDFLLALGTLVAIAVLLRLQRFVRHFFRRNPALVSVLVGVVVLAYIFLTNGTTNITTIVLTDLDIWLALAAFAIVLYSSFVLVRLARALRRGR
ncbi:MAG: hypothetical protein ACRDHP_16535 [Ktedonobacterales bacterium]